MPRSISAVARDIMSDWNNVYYGAVPYLQAMLTLDSVTDSYGYDDAKSIVLYFLSNATRYKGGRAKELKAELKTLIK